MLYLIFQYFVSMNLQTRILSLFLYLSYIYADEIHWVKTEKINGRSTASLIVVSDVSDNKITLVYNDDADDEDHWQKTKEELSTKKQNIEWEFSKRLKTDRYYAFRLDNSNGYVFSRNLYYSKNRQWKESRESDTIEEVPERKESKKQKKNKNNDTTTTKKRKNSDAPISPLYHSILCLALWFWV
ncbi:hypothetical protein ENBRE01_3177 [Enteropsectra breve]|nr:hypothetical protein ENBRE01_3177 [Enteropsectra breve]